MAANKKVSRAATVKAQAKAVAVAVAEAPAAVVAAGENALRGGHLMPSAIEIGGIPTLPDTVIAGAFESSKLTVEQWNALSDAEHEAHLSAHTATLTESVKTALPFIPETVAEVIYPVRVMLRNNGGFAISEPVSGAFLQAGGSQSITLHDEAHASRVMDNLRELSQRHGLVGSLVVDGFPFTNK